MPKLIDDAAVYQAVLQCVLEEGYVKATTKRLAEVADIHETTLFDKYGSKIELVMQALAFHLSQSPLQDLTYTGDLRADLISIMQAYQEANATSGDIINALILQIPAEPQLKSVMPILLADVQFIIQILQKYQEQGLLKAEHTLILVGELIAPFFIQNQFARAMEGIDLPKIDFDRRTDYFLYGFGTKQS